MVASASAVDHPLLDGGAEDAGLEILDLTQPDVIIVIPNWDTECRSDSSNIIHPAKVFAGVFHLRDEKEFTKMQGLKTRNSATIGECRKAFFDDVCAFLVQKNLSCAAFVSATRQDIFLRIAVAHSFCEELAEKSDLRVQTTKELIVALGIDQDLDKVSPAYMNYERQQFRSKQKLLNCQVVKLHYDRDRKHGSMLRTVDRIKMVYATIFDRINIESLVDKDVVTLHFPHHTFYRLAELRNSWANFGRIFDLSVEQPLAAVRDYFGSELAFFWTWFGYTIRSLSTLVPFGIFFFVVKTSCPDRYHLYAYGANIFMLTMWTILYEKFWKREQNHWRLEWDVTHAHERAVVRAQYRGDPMPSQWDKNVLTRSYPAWKTTVAQIVYVIVFLVFLAIVSSIVAFLLQPSVGEWMKSKFGSRGQTVRSLIISVQIKIFKKVWSLGIVPWLVNLLNPRTNAEYVNHMVLMLVPFNVINAYFSFFYVAYFKRYTVGCRDDDCGKEVVSSLYTTYLSLAAMSVVELVLPLMELRINNWWSKRQFRNLGIAEPERSLMEISAERPLYYIDDQVRDFLEVVIQLGYAVLFGSIAPLVMVPCFLLLLVELRMSAWRAVSIYQRPEPITTNGIGAWNGILRILMSIARINGIAVPIMNLESLQHLPVRYKLVLVIAAKECGDILMTMVDWMFDDEAQHVKDKEAQRRYVQTKWNQYADTNHENGNVVDEQFRLRQVTHNLRPLDKDSMEWKHLEREEDVYDKACSQSVEAPLSSMRLTGHLTQVDTTGSTSLCEADDPRQL